MNHHNQFVPLEDANNRNPEGNNCPWYWLLITFFMLLIGFVVAALMFIQTEDLLFAFFNCFFRPCTHLLVLVLSERTKPYQSRSAKISNYLQVIQKDKYELYIHICCFII